MLKLHDTVISAQNFGTSIAVFLQGEKSAIESMFNSFWNHEATSGKLVWDCESCAYFWVSNQPEDRLWSAMVKAAQAEIMNAGSKGTNALARAFKVANARFDAIDWVNWIKFPKASIDLFDLGTSVKAEKPNGDFSDAIVESLDRGANTQASQSVKDLQSTIESEELALSEQE